MLSLFVQASPKSKRQGAFDGLVQPQIALTLRARDSASLPFRRLRRARSGQCYLCSLCVSSTSGKGGNCTSVWYTSQCSVLDKSLATRSAHQGTWSLPLTTAIRKRSCRVSGLKPTLKRTLLAVKGIGNSGFTATHQPRLELVREM